MIVGADFGVINCAYVATKLPDGDRRISKIQDAVGSYDELVLKVDDIRVRLLSDNWNDFSEYSLKANIYGNKPLPEGV